MKILSLHIKNFLAIGNSGRLNLDRQGLVLIQGVNADDSSASSNGVGKSSIPDALSWVLFGETARGMTGDAVVNKTNKKNCQVTVEIAAGESTYKIIRFRKDAEFKNAIHVWVNTPEGYTDMSMGTEKLNQDLICEIVGCTKEVFMAAIYAGQETAPDLPAMTDKQLKLLVEEAAGIEKIEEALKVARARYASVAAQAAAMQNKIDTTKVRLADTENSHTRAMNAVREFEGHRKSRSDAAKDEARLWIKQASDAAEKLAAFDKTALANDLAELDRKLAMHKPLQELASAARRIATFKEGEARAAKERLQREINKAAELKKQMENPASVAKCSECGRGPEPEKMAEFTAHLSERFAAMMEQVGNMKAEYAAALKEAEIAHSHAESHEAAVPDVSEVAANRKSVAELIRQAEQLEDAMTRYKEKAKRFMQTAKEALTEPNPHAATLADCADRMVEFKKQLAGQSDALDALVERQRVLEEAVKVFGAAGVRAHILDTVTPYLNAQTADYLSALSDGNISATWSTLSSTAKGELREKFVIDVTNAKGAESFAGLSGGEKRKARLATMLALQDLVATRASNPIDLWIGDEIDHALDKNGMERLMGILERKAREKGTVLVISHNSLTDWCDRVVTVTKSGGVSTVTGALS